MTNLFSKKAIMAIALTGLLGSSTPSMAIHEYSVPVGGTAAALCAGSLAFLAYQAKANSYKRSPYYRNYQQPTPSQIFDRSGAPGVLILGAAATAAITWYLWRNTPRGKLNRAKKLANKAAQDKLFKATEDTYSVRKAVERQDLRQENLKQDINDHYGRNILFSPLSSALWATRKVENKSSEAIQLASEA
jgi:hypothetical protein